MDSVTGGAFAMHEQIEQYLNQLANEEGYSENTVAAYRNDLGQFAEWVAALPDVPSDWARLTSEQLMGFLIHMRERSYATSTMARKMAAIKSFFHHLLNTGAIPDDPTHDISTPKVKKGAPQALSREGVARLLDEPARHDGAKGLRDQAMLELLYATGIRVSELVSLTIDDLDDEQWLLRCGRGANSRAVPISPKAMGALSAYLDRGRRRLVRSDDERVLFLNMRGSPLTRQGLWLIIKQYVDSAGITTDVTPHTLRHSFAIHRLRAGSELSEVKDLLGHANISTTQVYTQARDDDA